jgi:hypothetical protein
LRKRRLVINVMPVEFVAIPATAGGKFYRRWVDLDEPLWHNESTLAALRSGRKESNRLKRLAEDLDQNSNTLATLGKVET